MKFKKSDLSFIESIQVLLGEKIEERCFKINSNGKQLDIKFETSDVFLSRSIEVEFENPIEELYIDILNYLKLTKKLNDNDTINIFLENDS